MGGICAVGKRGGEGVGGAGEEEGKEQDGELHSRWLWWGCCRGDMKMRVGRSELVLQRFLSVWRLGADEGKSK